MKRSEHFRFLVFLGILAVLGGVLTFLTPEELETRPQVHLEGRTMGTYYFVQLVGFELNEAELARLRGLVEAELDAVNQAMSTYMPDSEISRFNAMRETAPMPISRRFRDVVVRSQELYEEMEGAFDPTVGPLIRFWGFDRGEATQVLPDEETLAALQARTGMAHLELTEDGLSKSVPELEINLSAIAKGYAIDRVAHLLMEEGFLDLWVEIGGDLAVRGNNAQGVPWRVGISVPEQGAEHEILQRIAMSHGAMATSGDAQNFREVAGERMHHILDPVTGRPVETNLASVTIIAADCMTADAIATGIYVMGMDAGLAWIEARPGVEGLLIARGADGWVTRYTAGMEALLMD